MNDALKVLGDLLPTLVSWIEVALADGRDPKAELEAMMTSAELTAIAAEKAKFG